MFSEAIMTCLEQKVILMTHILDITKQIEVRCSEPEVNLEHLLDQRKNLMQRVNKCDNLIHNLTEQLPAEQQKRVLDLLNRTADNCDDEEQKALELIQRCNSLFQRAGSLDRSANEAIKRQYDDAKDHLRQLRKDGKGQNLFYNN
jgi:hypothetical protein